MHWNETILDLHELHIQSSASVARMQQSAEFIPQRTENRSDTSCFRNFFSVLHDADCFIIKSVRTLAYLTKLAKRIPKAVYSS